MNPHCQGTSAKKWNRPLDDPCITRMYELDFIKTNDVTSLDLLLIDEDKMFRPAKNEYRSYLNRNTAVTPFPSTSIAIPHHNFDFTEFEALSAQSENTYLTNAIGILISHTNLQQLKRSAGNSCFMRELVLENLRDLPSPPLLDFKLKVSLWGDSISELTINLDAHGTDPHPVAVVVASAYVKQYLCKPSLSSTNASKIYLGKISSRFWDKRDYGKPTLCFKIFIEDCFGYYHLPVTIIFSI
ncbi:hypothetical protein MKX01_030692 [Papaver californicum]|nr:hypothetical protein MKX01_030692 [Papaver californicum]